MWSGATSTLRALPGGSNASDEQRSDKGKGTSDSTSEAAGGTQTQITSSLIGRYALAWELGQALDHLCKDKSAPVEDLEKMIAAARTAGVTELTIQAAMAEAEQRRESHADAPRNRGNKNDRKRTHSPTLCISLVFQKMVQGDQLARSRQR